MDINDFMSGAMPGDLTLDQVTAYIMGVDPLDLKRLSVKQKVWIRYEIRRPNEEPVDADGNMSLDRFRELCAQGIGYIVISDRDGGLGVEAPTPAPLVDA